MMLIKKILCSGVVLLVMSVIYVNAMELEKSDDIEMERMDLTDEKEETTSKSSESLIKAEESLVKTDNKGKIISFHLSFKDKNAWKIWRELICFIGLFGVQPKEKELAPYRVFEKGSIREQSFTWYQQLCQTIAKLIQENKGLKLQESYAYFCNHGCWSFGRNGMLILKFNHDISWQKLISDTFDPFFKNQYETHDVCIQPRGYFSTQEDLDQDNVKKWPVEVLHEFENSLAGKHDCCTIL